MHFEPGMAFLPLLVFSAVQLPVLCNPVQPTENSGPYSVNVTVPKVVGAGELSNTYLDWNREYNGLVKAVFSHCDENSSWEAEVIGAFDSSDGYLPDRLAWVVPESTQGDGCVTVYGSDSKSGKPRTLGKSDPIQLHQQSKKRSNEDQLLLQDFDSLGAWFDGVASIKEKTHQNGAVTSDQKKKNASIAIVGAGISGLATGLMLDSVGVHNWEIIEASDRVGGRFRTKFVGGTQEWAEMGPMRLPHSVTYKNGETLEYTDHRMTFQLAEILNEMNHNDPEWKSSFIPWIQHHPNELIALDTRRHPDGRIPTRADIEADPSLDKPTPSMPGYNQTQEKMDEILEKESTLKELQRDVWRAHKHAMDQGLDDWSEQAMVRHVFKASENVTDEIWTTSDYDVFWDELHHNSNLGLDGSKDSLGKTEWKCIDQGFNKLSDAFLPHVRDRLSLKRKVRKLQPVQRGGQPKPGSRGIRTLTTGHMNQKSTTTLSWQSHSL